MRSKIRIAQQILKEKGFYNGKIDGMVGSKTLEAFRRFEGVNPDWPITRQVTITIQMGAKDYGIDAGPADGLWGQQTNAAYEMLVYYFEHGKLPPNWRPEERELKNPNNWPVQNSPEFHQFYGERCSQLITIDLPYTMKLCWDLRSKTRRTTCHKKVANSLLRVLHKVKEIYGEDEISRLHLDHYGGCHNERKMRNGNLWSMHSWGIALDFDPGRNQLKWGRDRAVFALPDYEEWWKCWEEEGWVSLGRARNFDWMHVQAARLPNC